jgi:hypothetical protein
MTGETEATNDDARAAWVILDDANGRERNSPRPFLVFDQANGTVVIADDYETSNDDTARDFVLGHVLINRPALSAFGQTGHRADIAE